MENNKYYTSEISEFHIGFECELNLNGKEWINRVLDKGDFNGLFFYKTLHKNNVRVKYLDQSDIESLGWEFENKHAGLEQLSFSINGPVYEDILYMDFDLDSRYMRIAWLGEGDITRFSGNIKNKSELIKLMQQLNIK